MRKTVLFTIIFGIVLSSCSKKTHPTVTKTNKKETEVVSKPTASKRQPEPVTVTEAPPAATTVTIAPAPDFSSPMIVIDESGKVITPVEKLPEEFAAKVDYKKISHAFTADQRKNLTYRFKMIPPRVLFVPENLSSKSARGTYVIYKKKFWYWRKEDGLFHLDETYYQ